MIFCMSASIIKSAEKYAATTMNCTRLGRYTYIYKVYDNDKVRSAAVLVICSPLPIRYVTLAQYRADAQVYLNGAASTTTTYSIHSK